jgi:hypothetical protein
VVETEADIPAEFTGAARPLTDADITSAAEFLYCDPAALRAVIEVESSGGGFLRDKRPKILFESRWFSRHTGGRYDRTHPDLSTPKWVRNYKGGEAEYPRLHRAIALDRRAALESTSWGLFQILGVNYKLAGFADVEAFVARQCESEGAHLGAFVAFVRAVDLADELRGRRWQAFARGYNGPGFRQNRYDEKLAEAYLRHSRDTGAWPSDSEIQQALCRAGYAVKVDGMVGARTKRALRQFQRRHGLPADGIAGPATLRQLGLL